MKPWFKIAKEDSVLYVDLTRKPKYLSNQQRLKMCIEKFKALRGAVIPETIRVDTGGYFICPLCWKYYVRNCRCDGCPIYGHTGISGCRGTPYDLIPDAVGANEIKAALDAEITFLEDVLESKEK